MVDCMLRKQLRQFALYIQDFIPSIPLNTNFSIFFLALLLTRYLDVLLFLLAESQSVQGSPRPEDVHLLRHGEGVFQKHVSGLDTTKRFGKEDMEYNEEVFQILVLDVAVKTVIRNYGTFVLYPPSCHNCLLH